ncbi:adenosylcobinamide-phosphate synthase CbiB [Bradyrhizobium sp. STM 3557]|uniref:adenosylcobinamide-phosphate synthase CbiB n=1 Tax=Bradyrhizobium sp. STM 3557 TaxID=578920 RepID=UPI0038909DF4
MFVFPALVALVIEATLGYPQALVRRIGHPVMWIGALIAWADRRWNRAADAFATRRFWGVALLIGLVGTMAAIGLLLTWLVRHLLPEPMATIALGLLASSLLAQRSLDQHVAAVATGLEQGGLEGGRHAVAMIVGRDPDRLDEAGVARAAIESLAENFSDGVVAPLVWLVVAGLPGILIYKAINTADSMIGHLSERHRAFGWAAARLDDLINLPASRLSALWLMLAACTVSVASPRGAWHAVWRDAHKHRSPNAGWPEAAMAGGLGLRLAGPRVYHSEVVADAWMGDGRAEADASDIKRALRLYRTACVIQVLMVAVLAFAIR